MIGVAEVNLDRHGIYFTPTEIAVHPDDGIGRLSATLGPAYVPRMGSEGRCPPNVQILPVKPDPRVQRGLAEVRRPGGGYVTLTLVRW